MALPSLADLHSLLGKLPPELVPLVIDTVRTIVNSGSPRHAALAAMAAAEKAASNAAADEALKRLHGGK